jgi:hypothetical protein
MAATNNWLLISESHVDSNRCTPCRGKIRSTRHILFHASPHTSGVHFLRVVPVRDNLSHWPNRVGQIHCSREKVLPTPPLSPAEWSVGPASVSLLTQPLKQCVKPNIYRQQTSRFTEPISPACDRYVQYLPTGINPSVLNRHRRRATT